MSDFEIGTNGISVSKLGCLSGLGAKESTMNFYKGEVKSEPLWKVKPDHFDRIRISSIWDLAIEIFGTDNKYYNTKEKNRLFSSFSADKSNSMYYPVLDSTCTSFDQNKLHHFVAVI